MKNFIVSTDSCSDFTKSHFEKNDIKYIVMKRIQNGKEIGEVYDKPEDFDAFYDSIKKGALPTTTQLNPFELKDYFEDILKKEKSGDIIHIPLSSGLSTTCINAISAADEINKSLESKGEKRRIYVVDSLHATLGMGQQVDKLVELRDAGVKTEDAIAQIKNLIDNQQTWVIVSDMFHLKRGGRISGVKAAIGTVLNIKPIIVMSHQGKLVIENKMRGNSKAVKYALGRIEKLGEKVNPNFINSKLWLYRTSQSELFEQVKDEIASTYPNLEICEGIVGPVVGTHLGCGAVTIVFEGAPRIEIE